jgi:nitric oxide reductase subunit B
MQSSIMHAFVWIRVPGDLVFSLGVGAFVLFMYRAFVDSWTSTRAARFLPASKQEADLTIKVSA